MELILKFLLLACFARAVSGKGSPPEDDIASLCGGRTLVVYAAEMLKADRMYLRAGSVCTLRVRSAFHSDYQEDKLRMQVLSLQAPCGEASLQLFDGDDHPENKLSGRMCGDISSQVTMFLSSNKNFITVDIQRYTSGFVSLSLLATATSHDYESTDFICDNLWDIDKSLQCDGYNNCGDWSDEASYFCTDDIGRWHVIIIVACSWTVFFIVLTCVIGFFVRRRRRRRLQYGNGAAVVSTPITGAGLGVQRVPAYGSIQAGTNPGIHPGHATTFLPAPPPYSLAAASKTFGGAAAPACLPPPPPYYSQQYNASAPPPSAVVVPAQPAAAAATATPRAESSASPRAASDTVLATTAATTTTADRH